MSNPSSRPDPEEMRAKDLVRYKEVQEHIGLWAETLKRLSWRLARRPAGSSARLWKKMGIDDPFSGPPDIAKPEHRAVYVAGRFVRLDQVDKHKGKKTGESFRDKLQRPPADADGTREPPKSMFTPDAKKSAPNPLKKAPKPRPEPPPPPQRTAPAVSSSGRFRPPSPAAASRKPVMSDAPPGGVVPHPSNAQGAQPKAPPSAPVAARPPAPASPPPKAPERPPATAATPPKPAAPPATPPRAEAPVAAPKPAPTAAPPAPTPPTSAPKPAPAAVSGPTTPPKPGTPIDVPIKLPPGAINVPGKAEAVPLRRPTRVEEPVVMESTKKPEGAPVNRAPPTGGGGGLDDLFGGAAQEGRVRIGPTRKKPTE